jgi:hypothetical protein
MYFVKSCLLTEVPNLPLRATMGSKDAVGGRCTPNHPTSFFAGLTKRAAACAASAANAVAYLSPAMSIEEE